MECLPSLVEIVARGMGGPPLQVASPRGQASRPRGQKRNFYFRDSAPDTISISSFVMTAWRVRLYVSDRLAIMSEALLVAFSMALMRAPCSLATLSSRERYSLMETAWGTSRSN